ncbi:MAG TPA: glycosyltransferase family 4 protein, partial [Segetibacter sp.]
SANTHLNELKENCTGLPYNILEKIKWVTNFSSEKKKLLFNAIDILVLPSHNESFGLVFLEAWSCKKPVVGTSIGAIRNVISEEKDGLLININDEKSLTSQLLRLINDKPLRVKLGENGYKKVTENYTWDIIVSRLRKCYIEASASKN